MVINAVLQGFFMYKRSTARRRCNIYSVIIKDYLNLSLSEKSPF